LVFVLVLDLDLFFPVCHWKSYFDANVIDDDLQVEASFHCPVFLFHVCYRRLLQEVFFFSATKN
jgi:hypothetical protein